MHSLHSSIVNYLQPAGAGMRVAYAVNAPNVQVLSPPVSWNWDAAAVGQMNLDQFTFCDAMPQDATAKVYVAGSRSFSNGYSSFLQLINLQSFPAPSLVTQSISANVSPQGLGPATKGWAQAINQAGQLEWKRVWNISQTPQAWLAAVDQNPNNQPVELVFNDPGLSIYTQGGMVAPTPGTAMKITSKAIGRIQVNPDSWYDSSVVTIAESNQNYFIVNPSVVFGNVGLINCRIAEFIVALKPEPSVTVDNSFINQQSISQSSITGISLGGFAFTNQNAFTAGNKRVVEKVNFSLSPVDAMRTVINGNITGAESDNIFIIAVILEINAMS
jgi:hypothetical protein